MRTPMSDVACPAHDWRAARVLDDETRTFRRASERHGDRRTLLHPPVASSRAWLMKQATDAHKQRCRGVATTERTRRNSPQTHRIALSVLLNANRRAPDRFRRSKRGPERRLRQAEMIAASGSGDSQSRALSAGAFALDHVFKRIAVRRAPQSAGLERSAKDAPWLATPARRRADAGELFRRAFGRA